MDLINSYSWLNKNSLLLSAAFGLISFLVLLIVKSYASLSYLPDISGSESSSIFPIQLLIDGDPIYTDPEKAPFRFAQYTPIYFCIVAFFYKLTGWPATEVHKVFVFSRFFSITFTLLATLSTGYLIYKLANRNKVIAFVSAAFVYHVLAFWFLTGSRPDSLLVLITSLYLIAIYNALSADKNDIWWYVAIFLAVTAFFVKQSGTVHSITLGLYLLINKQWKLAAKITATGIVVFAIYLFILPINTIPLFISNIVGGVANSTSWEWFYFWTMEKWVLQFVVLMVLNMVISAYVFFRNDSPFYRFLSLGSLLFFSFATMTSFKIGAGVGYYQDYLIIAVVLIAAFLSDRTQADKFTGKFNRIGLALYLVFVYLHCTLFVSMAFRDAHSPTFVSRYIEQRKVTEYLYNEKKLKSNEWVLSDGGTDFSGYFIRHFLFKQAIIPFSDVVYLADKNKTFEFSAFKNMIQGRKVKYVITDHGRYPQNILNYSFANTLRFCSNIGAYDIYESKQIAEY